MWHDSLNLLGIVSPVTILFKIFFQQLCGAGIVWNDTLTDELLERWKLIQASLAGADSICIPFTYYTVIEISWIC